MNLQQSSHVHCSELFSWQASQILGKGTFGAVYQGIDRHDGKQVAVKVQNGIKHFRKEECEILIKARHENVVALYGWEEVIDFSHKNICSC